MSSMRSLRQTFHQDVCLQAIYLRNGSPSIADSSSKLSKALAQKTIAALGYPLSHQTIKGQTAGLNFEQAVERYLKSAFRLLNHLRPAEWIYSIQGDISQFEQYQHLAELKALIHNNKEARTALGDYVVKPDVIVARMPVNDEEINRHTAIIEKADIPNLTPLRRANQVEPVPILHASVSCKLTIRSDRSQNARTEGLNLIRNRKGHTPHIVVVTAEPMPTRIASLALGTGDIDCVYHFALDELVTAAQFTKNEAVVESLGIMIDGNRLRDIADLPFDLII